MPLADYDAYVDALRANRAADFQTTTSGRPARMSALYRSFLPSPAIPTTSVALDDGSNIAIGPLPATSGGKLSILGARINPGGNSGVALIVADILNHSGGLDGRNVTAQTTNLPTAALTRYTSGVGVMAALVVYVLPGTVATTVTASYTNQAGTSGRTTTAIQFGGTGFREVNAFIQLPLQAGDTGVRSVESVTLAGDTGTNGNFGVVLFKPLAMMALNNFEGAHVIDAVSSGGLIGALAQAETNACVSLLYVPSMPQPITGSILLAEV